MPKTIPVLVIEDNRLMRDALAAVLAEQRDLNVVGAVAGASPALQLARETHPHVVLVDASLADHNSHQLVANLKQAAPKARVIVMDLLPVEQDVIAFLKAGACGFIVKDATVENVVRTVRLVAQGEDVLPRVLIATVLSHIASGALGRSAVEAIAAVRMTSRERDVMRLITDGLSNKEIAQRLYIATNTVKGHVHNILDKLTLRTRLQIAAYARTTDTPIPVVQTVPSIQTVPLKRNRLTSLTPPKRSDPISIRKSYRAATGHRTRLGS